LVWNLSKNNEFTGEIEEEIEEDFELYSQDFIAYGALIPCKTRDREIKERWREVKEQRPFIVLYISDIFFRDL